MKTFSDADFEKYMIESEPVVKVLPASAWRDQVDDLLTHGFEVTGAKLPWSKTHDHLRFRSSEVTLWQGINGHGKSQMLGQACLWFMAQGEGVCIASFEMKPQATYFRMLRQASMNDRPTKEFSDKLFDWSEDRFYIYDHLGAVDAQRVYAAIQYAARELGLKHFVVDNLMKCVRNEDDYSGQKSFVDRCCSLARELEIHIHLVHHVRKGQSENDIPTKFDSRGSGTITDQVDQVLTVWRNKGKQAALQKNPDDQEIKEQPDALLVCDKNRHGEWEGRISLWYHAPSLQYTGDKRAQPIELIMEGV